MKLARSVPLFLLFSISIACSLNPKPQVTPGYYKEESPPEPVTLRVYPPFSPAGAKGATVSVVYAIARHPDNKSYWLFWSDEIGEVGGKGKSLEGENELYTFPQILVDKLYRGDYTVVLILTRIENGVEKKYRAIAKFSVY